MNRREALSAVALLMGGTIVGAKVFLTTGCGSREDETAAGSLFTGKQVAFLDEVAETIIPTTTTPGAKAARVGAFMAVMVTDCYSEEEQKIFTDGISTLEEACNTRFSKGFMDCSPEQRTELLIALDQEQKDYHNDPERRKAGKHYFRMMRELTLLGYFTSEIGATQALRYVETPAGYDACIDYKKGDKLWADA